MIKSMNVEIVNKINDSPYKCFVAITGGGASFIADYTKISGASKTIVGAIVPYDRTIFDNFVGIKMQEYSSPLAARKLALASYNQCIIAGVEPKYAIGIGAASSIAFDGERVGRQHKINIAIHKFDSTKVVKIVLEQGRTREQEDKIISDYIFTIFASSIFPDEFYYPVTISYKPTETIEFTTEKNKLIQQLVNGEKDFYCNASFGAWQKLAIYGGSFNLLHDGHKQIKELAEKILGYPVWFELSITNADKGMIDYVDINERLRHLYDIYLITKHSTIKDKVDLIKKYNPECEITFIIGADTWTRIWDIRYLPNMSLNDLHDFFYNSDVKFLVFGRNGIKINDNYNDLRIMSEEAENFNMNISSTELRNKNEDSK